MVWEVFPMITEDIERCLFVIAPHDGISYEIYSVVTRSDEVSKIPPHPRNLKSSLKIKDSEK